MENYKTCCFTGHRPPHLPWGKNERDQRCIRCKELLALEIERAIEAGYQRFLCGMAMGTDLICAELVLQSRQLHVDVWLEAVIPCADQTRGWPLAQIRRYDRILGRLAPSQQILIQQERTRECMLRRNAYMVNQSQRVIALYDGRSTGGTSYTLARALEQKREVVIIDPYTLTVDR